MTVTRDTPLTSFPGVGEARAKKLEKLGLTAAGDLLTYYPRDYEDRRTLYSIQDAPLKGRVCVAAVIAERPRLAALRQGLDLVKARAVDDAGTLDLTFFNQNYVCQSLRPGEEYIFYGTVEQRGSLHAMVNPIFERAGRQSFTGCIMPVYPLTAGISNHMLASARSTGWPPWSFPSKTSTFPNMRRPWTWPSGGSPSRSCFTCRWASAFCGTAGTGRAAD